MASSYNFTFDNLSRIGDDVCGISERDMQNQQFGSYSTQNYFEKFCGLKQPLNFATQQPNVTLGAGYGVSDSCKINDDSNLRIKQTQTNPKCRISLRERPFKTVPYLGRGPHNPTLESKLMQGKFIADKKSCKQVMEKSFRTTDVDLVPSLKATIQNPSNLVEGVAVNGWIRGGLPSREVTRDNDYFKRRN
tara:strand:+ start:1814 stop:2386 length:573 start_codon:yes stop_codon:yes gene_type:complete